MWPKWYQELLRSEVNFPKTSHKFSIPIITYHSYIVFVILCQEGNLNSFLLALLSEYHELNVKLCQTGRVHTRKWSVHDSVQLRSFPYIKDLATQIERPSGQRISLTEWSSGSGHGCELVGVELRFPKFLQRCSMGLTTWPGLFFYFIGLVWQGSDGIRQNKIHQLLCMFHIFYGNYVYRVCAIDVKLCKTFGSQPWLFSELHSVKGIGWSLGVQFVSFSNVRKWTESFS